jgi:hypothetical protein
VVELAQQTELGQLGGAANRRAAFRIEISCPVEVTVVDKAVPGTDTWERKRPGHGRRLRTITEDVSMTGARLRMPELLRKGTRATLRIEHGDELAEVVAEVMHGGKDVFGAHAGMHFMVIEPQTRAALTRFIAREDRRRLPNVRVMYDATCMIAGNTEAIEGSTQECTPGFVRFLLRRPVEPATPLRATVSTTGQRFQLGGYVVTSRRAGDLWSTGVHLSDDDPVVAETWANLLAHLRATRQ